jgi:excisionase family DNA binding protein
MPEQAAREYYTVPDAADAVEGGPRTIYAAIKRGELAASSINLRGDLRIHRDDLRDWMRRRRVAAVSA